ncbi:MAG: asparagine synthetase A [Candidatus Micrarchaeota archaeon]|nr:asparagine synthetase A [Candidatus Micrarchaeota archaeon]MCX8154400.1 asparagine synthetase A [Candidatus Micrarchaeota archaeon]
MKKEVLYVQSYLLNRLTSFLYKNGFVWMLPVILSKSTDPLFPDPSGSVIAVPEVEIYGQKLFLTQSMIVHKQYMISQGFDRIFVLSPNIRVERPERASTGKHLFEFTQLDFEIAEFDDIKARAFIEKMLDSTLRYIKIDMNIEMKNIHSSFRIPKPPFKVYDYRDILAEYGENWEEMLVKSIDQPVWIVNIPRYFYDMQDEDGRWHNYDLYVPKYGEILSGGQREYQYDKIIRKMERDGINRSKYTKLLELAKEGRLRPSAGAGIGIERLVRWVTDAVHIREIQPFPRVPGENIEL